MSSSLAQKLERFAEGENIDATRLITREPENALEVFPELFIEDRPISEVEILEALYKRLLKHIVSLDKKDLAYLASVAQKRTGFILKYKPHGIKATIPLGFSLFFLEPNEGFSFQRHIDIKTEMFNFISISEGGFVYFCQMDEWEKMYSPKRFSAWLEGAFSPSFEQFRYIPKPGDVIRIDKTNLVHTAIGCVLEEYSNISTDMVDRLHDQNKGKKIPPKFNRRYFSQKMDGICYPEKNHLIEYKKGKFITSSLEWAQNDGIFMMPLMETPTYKAERVSLPANSIWRLNTGGNFVSAFLSDGEVNCELTNSNENPVEKSFDLSRHDAFLSLPGCEWQIRNLSASDSCLSVLTVREKYALL
ncbi:MAG: hypothetical protein CEN90_650 [Parcubacteria group bacterium Licking1014_17]|nr:MAG: hypothetical protein CEN90_650 [Parcubacteria group bacterium Licking1014_17]